MSQTSLSWPKAFLFAVIVCACAFIFASQSALYSQSSSGGFMIAGDGQQFVWRVNTESGAVSYCVRRDNSVDPGLLDRRAPYCSKESRPAL